MPFYFLSEAYILTILSRIKPLHTIFRATRLFYHSLRPFPTCMSQHIFTPTFSPTVKYTTVCMYVSIHPHLYINLTLHFSPLYRRKWGVEGGRKENEAAKNKKKISKISNRSRQFRLFY